MFDRDGFRSFYFTKVGSSPASFNTYSSYLKRMDTVLGGLDSKFDELGGEGLFKLTETAADEPFVSHRSQCRAILGAYIAYRQLDSVGDVEEEVTGDEAVASVFRYERELQEAVRKQLSALEPGLVVDDQGYEAIFETGRSDILARDANGAAVVIELKAGKCPKGAIEQVLGYADDWAASGEQKVRAIVVAGEFSPRQIAAANRIPDLELKTYQLSLQFTDAT